MKHNKISIIVPVYNSELYIEKCIQSIIDQTNRSFELILIDDGSSDDSIKLVKKLLLECSKKVDFKIYHQENLGVSSARNKGIELSKGNYLYFVDSDDYLNKNAVAWILDAIKDMPKANFFCGDYNKIKATMSKYDLKQESRQVKLSSNTLIKNVDFLKKINESKVSFWLGSTVFSKENFISNSVMFSENKSYGEDLEVMYKSLFINDYVGVIPKKLSNYNVHDNSLTTNYNFKQLQSIHTLLNLVCCPEQNIDQNIKTLFYYQTIKNNLIYNIKNLRQTFSGKEILKQLINDKTIREYIKELKIYDIIKIIYYLFRSKE
ncbi:glycosyltransferase family A protein [Exiguobacterium sp. s16]|uniref:glycosyltransferase family 2 protein n=1 Tax=Exiguobacterium sp. s16 TaxID=2751237 RepID=UPI001BEAE508|nr:glycosyltransferase family A protein [Exiguobacterium sp. s16]